MFQGWLLGLGRLPEYSLAIQLELETDEEKEEEFVLEEEEKMVG